MKYKELPAFETNEFKVGDLVKCYDSEVSDDNEIIEVIVADKIYLKNYTYSAHFKTCRKLEEIKPREFWIVGREDEFYVYENEPKDITLSEGFKKIRVREVLED